MKVGIVGGSRPCNVHSHIGLTNQDTICSFGFVKYCDNPTPHGDPIEGDDFVDQFFYFVGFPYVGLCCLQSDRLERNVSCSCGCRTCKAVDANLCCCLLVVIIQLRTQSVYSQSSYLGRQWGRVATIVRTHTQRRLPNAFWLMVDRTVVRSSPRLCMLRSSSAVAMVDDDIFEVGVSIRVNNRALLVDVAIHPSFIKLMDDDSRFVSLDFYRSRGVYTLLSSRLPQEPPGGRKYSKLIANVVGALKRKRDHAFRQSVITDAPLSREASFHAKDRGSKSVMPRNRALKAIAMSKSDVVQFEVDAFDDEFDGYRVSCVVPLERHNGNTELWIDAQSKTWNYLSKLVAHEYSSNGIGVEDQAQTPIDSPSTTTSTIETEPWSTPMASRHSPKRQSRGHDPAIVECAPPAKRQTNLLSYMRR